MYLPSGRHWHISAPWWHNRTTVAPTEVRLITSSLHCVITALCFISLSHISYVSHPAAHLSKTPYLPLRAQALLQVPLQLPLLPSNREYLFISPSPSPGYLPTSLCTLPHVTSLKKSWGYSRVACIAGGVKWKMIPVVGPPACYLQPFIVDTYSMIYLSTSLFKRTQINISLAYTNTLFLTLFPSDLQGSITRIHRTIELMYSDKSMMQVGDNSLLYYKIHISWTLCNQVIKSTLLVYRFHTGFMLCWSMKARPMQATTGLISMTHISVAGWSTMTFQWPSHHGRSWSGTLLEDTATPVPTVSCTSTTRSHFS